jgi:hypothetical protein
MKIVKLKQEECAIFILFMGVGASFCLLIVLTSQDSPSAG